MENLNALLVLAAAFVVLDAIVSYVRMREYGPAVELNPLAGYLARRTNDPLIGVAALILQNTILVSVLVLGQFHTLLAMLVGAKMGLAALQLKSLELLRKVKNVESK